MILHEDNLCGNKVQLSTRLFSDTIKPARIRTVYIFSRHTQCILKLVHTIAVQRSQLRTRIFPNAMYQPPETR